MTEAELLSVFHSVASGYVRSGGFSPGALLWIERQIELAAARGAGDPALTTEAVARDLATEFFARVVGAATPSARFRTGAGLPLITEVELETQAASFSFWPFGERPHSAKPHA